MGKKITPEEFIEKANDIHHDKYDYSKVEYKNTKTKICIICPEHGEFWQTPEHHLNGHGCRACQYEKFSEERKDSFDAFIEKANKTHNGIYIYDKDSFENREKGGKIKIICPEHGEFWQRPIIHVFGEGCPKCGRIKANKSESMTTSEFIEKSNLIHNNKYSYDLTEYVGFNDKVHIICPEHGEFWQIAGDHLHGHGCPECKKKTLSDLYKMKPSEFIYKASEIHSNKYDYSKTEYVNNRTKVCIICPEHGEFWQTPGHHLNGVGCPLCRESKMEIEIANFLAKENIIFTRQYTNEKLNKLSLDFYIPKYKAAIECQGEQHFMPIKHFGGTEKFNKTTERDERKRRICEECNIKLFYFAKKQYNENIFTDKEQMLQEIKNTVND